MSLRNDELLTSGEFDVQLSIIKVKAPKKNKFHVKFDIISGQLLEISPAKIINTSVRHNVIEIDDSGIIGDVLNNKISYHDCLVKFSIESGTHILTKRSRLNKIPELLMHCARNKESSPININFDFTYKKAYFSVNYLAYKNFMSSMALSESDLSNTDFVKIFFIDSNDYTKLYGMKYLNLQELLLEETVEMSASWLPDYNDNSISAMATASNFDISLNDYSVTAETFISGYIKPQILYKQEDNVLFLQSIMENTDNYKIKNDVKFYIYKQNDPGTLLGTLKVDSKKLRNFGSFSFIMNNTSKVSVTTDHKHLYIEDNNVSTYYKF